MRCKYQDWASNGPDSTAAAEVFHDGKPAIGTRPAQRHASQGHAVVQLLDRGAALAACPAHSAHGPAAGALEPLRVFAVAAQRDGPPSSARHVQLRGHVHRHALLRRGAPAPRGPLHLRPHAGPERRRRLLRIQLQRPGLGPASQRERRRVRVQWRRAASRCEDLAVILCIL